MLRVGLTGGLACGKSFVGRTLASFGCHLIQADELGHQVLLPQGEAYDAVVSAFGESVLDGERTIDRRKLAAVVFQDPGKLEQLTAIVHPAVIRREEELLAGYAKTDPGGIVVVEAAILVETGTYRAFDRLIVAVCSPEEQVERAMHRDGCSKEEALARLSRQLPPEEKTRMAHYVIDTSGSKERTVEQTREVYELLRRLSP